MPRSNPQRQHQPPALVSVVIPARDVAATIGEQLDALAQQRGAPRFEVVVVDNGSTDDTSQIVSEYAARDMRFRCLPAHERAGINYARNCGVEASRGELILFCDADDVVCPEWVSEMTAAALSADLIGGPLEIHQINDGPTQNSRPRPHPPGQLPVSFGFLPYAIGANLGVWRDLILAVGGFDEDAVSTADDIDFCWRLQLLGYRLVFAEGARVHYRYRTSAKATLTQAYRYGQGDVWLFSRYRHHGLSRGTVRGMVKAVLRILLDGLRQLPDANTRRMWLWRACHLLGRWRGAIRNRTVML